MRKVLLLSFFMLLTTLSFAQYQEAKHGLGIRANFINYQWPITDNFDNNDFSNGIEIEYVRHLSNWLNLGIPFKIGKGFLPLDEMGNVDDQSLLSLDATLQLKYFKESAFIFPYAFAGVGAVYEGLEEFTFAAPVGIGLNFRLGKHAYLSAKGEYRFGFEDLRDNLQLSGGLFLILGEGKETPPPVTDTDGDGVPDNQDLCPTVAGIVGLNGCPDKDGDGVTDRDDECPDVAGVAALNGCPDTDGDGIADKDDECPNEAGTADRNGCPVRDADGDGVEDENDDCPNEAGTAALRGCPDGDGDGVADKNDDCPNEAGTAAANGCPDNDNDGVINSQDKCPDTPGPASNAGCPEIKQEDKEVLQFATQAVQFRTARATLTNASFEVLDQVADILNKYPDYKLRIGGHTDSVGSSSKNQTLSEKRAKACYDYILSKGIDASRVSYAGYGESKPIGDNRYKAGRDQNRRVEFDVYLE